MAKKQKTTQQKQTITQNNVSTQQQNKSSDLKSVNSDLLKVLNIDPNYLDTSQWLMTPLDYITNNFKPLVPNNSTKKSKLIKKEPPYKSNPVGIRKYDFKGGRTDKKLAEGKYPYANTTPYKGVKTYDARRITTRPIINYQQFEDLLNDTTGKVITFDRVPYSQKTVLKAKGGENNNPCNISVPSEYAVGAVGLQKMGDGQKAGKFDNIVNGVASTMRLYRERYGNRSFPQMNNGMQEYYRRNEPIGLTALRLIYVTNKCKQLGIDPNAIINTDDKWTLCSFVDAMAQSETGSTLSRELLDKAYKVAFGE